MPGFDPESPGLKAATLTIELHFIDFVSTFFYIFRVNFHISIFISLKLPKRQQDIFIQIFKLFLYVKEYLQEIYLF